MPQRKQKRMIIGNGFFDDVWSGIKSVAPVVNNIAKSTGILGNLAGSLNPTAGAVVKSLGYGKRRRTRGRGKKAGLAKVIKA